MTGLELDFGAFNFQLLIKKLPVTLSIEIISPIKSIDLGFLNKSSSREIDGGIIRNALDPLNSFSICYPPFTILIG